MSLKVNSITDKAGTGAPTFDYGIKLPTTGGTATTLDFYEEISLTLDNNLTGTAKLIRVGKVVTLMGTGVWTHSSLSVVTSSVGLVPTRFRPIATTFNTFGIAAGTAIQRVLVRDNGEIQLAYFDASLTALARSDSEAAPNLTYITA